MSLQDKLKEIEENAEKTANMSSDDFGHDTTKLAEWSMNALDFYSNVQIPKLLAVIKLLIEQRDSTGSSWDDYHTHDKPKFDADLAKILESK